jgi:hypothetical protein
MRRGLTYILARPLSGSRLHLPNIIVCQHQNTAITMEDIEKSGGEIVVSPARILFDESEVRRDRSHEFRRRRGSGVRSRSSSISDEITPVRNSIGATVPIEYRTL